MQPLLITSLVMAILLVVTPDVLATSSTVIGDSFCNVVGWMSGKTGKAFVILAMTITAILALFNKISWEKTLISLAAETVILKAPDMVSAISSGGMNC